MMKQEEGTTKAIRQIDFIARLMDSQFRIPGTNLRFGLDAIVGLIPGVGDMSTFAVSAYLLLLMARNGASGYVMARMVLNVLIDVVIGSIPIVGDLFDFGFKANTRNMKLMHEHLKQGRHKGSAAKVVVPVVLVLLIIFSAIVYSIYKLIVWIF